MSYFNKHLFNAFPKLKYFVYLLHFPNKVGGRQHYVGLCKQARIRHRMKEHAAGRGGRTTRQMALQNDHFLIMEIWATDDPELEQKIKKRGGYSKVCAHCMGLGELPAYAKIPITIDIEKEREATALLKAASL